MRSSSLKINKNNFEIGKFRGVLFCAMMLLSPMYGYLVLSSVVNISQREKLSDEISAITAKVSVLEANYITMRSAINIDVAGKLGMKEEFNKINFASADKGDVKGGLSYVNNEI